MICEHGQLARQCDHCDKDRELAEIRSRLALAEKVVEAARSASFTLHLSGGSNHPVLKALADYDAAKKKT